MLDQITNRCGQYLAVMGIYFLLLGKITTLLNGSFDNGSRGYFHAGFLQTVCQGGVIVTGDG